MYCDYDLPLCVTFLPSFVIKAVYYCCNGYLCNIRKKVRWLVLLLALFMARSHWFFLCISQYDCSTLSLKELNVPVYIFNTFSNNLFCNRKSYFIISLVALLYSMTLYVCPSTPPSLIHNDIILYDESKPLTPNIPCGTSYSQLRVIKLQQTLLGCFAIVLLS